MKFISFILSLALLPNLAFAGRESGGGDSYALEFLQVAQQVSQYLKGQKDLSISVQKVDEAITKTLIESTDENLVIDGKSKDAINYPKEMKIVINRQAWKRMSLDTKPALVLHEYLGILRIDDVDYSLSRKLIGAFRYSGTPEENFQRGVLATTKLFPVIQDRYSQDKGVGFILLAEISTDARSRNNRMLVIGLPDGASDWVKSTVDTGLDTVDSIRLDGTSLVVSGNLYDWEKDTLSSSEVRIRIKKTAGSDHYLSHLKLETK